MVSWGGVLALSLAATVAFGAGAFAFRYGIKQFDSLADPSLLTAGERLGYGGIAVTYFASLGVLWTDSQVSVTAIAFLVFGTFIFLVGVGVASAAHELDDE